MTDSPDPAPIPLLTHPLGVRLPPPVPALKPVFMWVGLLLTILFGVSLGAHIHTTGAFPEVPFAAWLAIGAGFGLLSALYLGRGLRVPAELPPITFDGRLLTLPLDARHTRLYQVALADVDDVEILGPGQPAGRLIISTRRGPGPFVFPLGALVQPEEAVTLARFLVAHIARGPDGGERLLDMERKREVLRRIRGQRPRGTHAFLALIGVMFGLQYLAGAFHGPEETQAMVMVHLGANSATLLADGEWWRLFVANFLHGGTVHVVFNGLALLSLGSLMERLIGTPRFILIYLGSALAGALASDLFSHALFSVGASTAIFGLLGAFAVLSWRFGPQLPAGIRQSRRWWIIILGANAALPLLIPIIDVSAHAGGFFAGALLMYLSYPSVPHFDPWARPALGILGASAVLSLVFMVAGIEGGRAMSTPTAESKQAFLHMLEQGDDVMAQNMYAWLIAVDPEETSQATLQKARDRAAATVSRAPSSGVMDTLATTEHRLGHPDEAADLEREALRLARRERTKAVDGWRMRLAKLVGERVDLDDGLFHSQLARFLWARGPEQLPRRDGEQADAVSLSIDGDEVVLARPPGTPAWVFAELRAGDEPKGYVQVGVAGDDDTSRWSAPARLQEMLSGQVDLHVLWFDTRPPGEDDLGLSVSRHAAEVDAYP
ncbi:MAG: rhomboid family intramembrane serine protease [Myxococcales bacterium]|nr:rhomboid family intramembrane serine protease [Myxococcales bacterium]